MSTIPSSAMPHTFVHEDDEEFGGKNKQANAAASGPSAGTLIGGAVAAYLLYRILR